LGFALTTDSFAAPFVAARDPQCVDVAPNGSAAATAISGLSNSEDPPRPHPDVRKSAIVTMFALKTDDAIWRYETFGDWVDLRFSPDSKWLGAARLFFGDEGLALHEVMVWNADSGERLRAYQRCHGFAFSPASDLIAVLGRKSCAIFDLAVPDRMRVVEGLGGALSIAWAPKGDRLAGVVRDANGQLAPRIVAADTGKTIASALPFEEPFYNLCYSPDGKRLASGHPDGSVLLWDADLGLEQQLLTGIRGLSRPFFSPSGKLLAAGDQTTGQVVFWSTETWREVQRHGFDKCSFHTHLLRGEGIRERPERDPHRFCFTPDDEAFLTGCYGGILRRVDDGQELKRLNQ
jgi:WD40 repeat protein